MVVPELNKFHAISVREQTGKNIVNNMGFDAVIALDPTLLLEQKDYDELILSEKPKKSYQLFSYILHENQTFAHKLKDYVFEKYFDKDEDMKYENEPISITEWLCSIKNSRFVVTNSFHGTIFSLIFHKSFIVVPVEGSDMNDRIATLLNSIGLSGRIVTKTNESNIDRLFCEAIDWEQIDDKLHEYKKLSIEFLRKSLA